MKYDDELAQAKLASIKEYVPSAGVPCEALLKMAKLAAVIEQWMQATEVTISAVLCWTSLEENLGIVPCTVVSMMSNQLLSSACEVDICGVVGMHVLRWRPARLRHYWTGTTITAPISTRPSVSIVRICPGIFSARPR